MHTNFGGSVVHPVVRPNRQSNGQDLSLTPFLPLQIFGPVVQILTSLFILAVEDDPSDHLSTHPRSILYRAPSCFGDLNAAVAASIAPSGRGAGGRSSLPLFLPYLVDLNINHVERKPFGRRRRRRRRRRRS